MRQRDLSGRRGGLRILEAGAAAGRQSQAPRAERDRARRHDDQLLARAVPRGEIGDLFVSGPSSALMYWGNREKSRATFQG